MGKECGQKPCLGLMVLWTKNISIVSIMKAAIYVRVSTKEQSPDNQLIGLRSFCIRMGYTIYSEYADQISGSKSEMDRPAFKKMMDDAQRRKFDLLIFWSLDRLSRESVIPTIQYLQRLEDLGIQFKSFTEGS